MPEDRPPELLLVDDDDAQVTLYERSLAPFFAVTASRSGPQALEVLRAKSFDILLSDHMMPEMTGVELLARARQLRPAMRRVIMSAYAAATDVLPSIDAGDVHHFVAKPVVPAALRTWFASFAAVRRTRCIAIAQDRAQAADVLADLSEHGFDATLAASIDLESPVDLVLFIGFNDAQFVESELRRLRRKRPEVVVMAALAPDMGFNAAGYLAAGVDDVIWLPLRPRELALRVQTWSDKRDAARESHRVRTEAISREPFADVIGRSPAMQRVFQQVHRVAATDVSILLGGETGTGKEMIARVIHLLSPRRDAPFMAVNLSAIPETLLESELFGHERGAFTGAQAMRKGRIEEGHGGTLFLDEIGDLTPNIQVKLLRVLEQRSYERLGSSTARAADFRLVCATHRDLEALVREGRFREDLFYRINVVRIELPPLRERKNDIPLLAEHFLEMYADAYKLQDVRFSDTAIQAMQKHHWPGNVRELKHAIERAAAMGRSNTILDDDVLWLRPARISFIKEMGRFVEGEHRGLNELLADLERAILAETLQRCGGSQMAAARKLKVPRQTLRNRLKKYGL
jgi:DNA-binding NtrC family response regulator